MRKILFVMFLAAMGASALLVNAIVRQNATIAALNTQIGALHSENENLKRLVASQTEAIERIKSEAKTQSEAIARAAINATTQRIRAEAHAQEILNADTPNETQDLIAWAVLEAQKLSITEGEV